MKEEIIEKFLSKSSKFNYYKDNYLKFKEDYLELKTKSNELNQENKDLTQENNNLKKLLKEAQNEKNAIVNIRQNEKNAMSFCNWNYADLYYQDDFDEIFQKMLKDLPPKSKRNFKLIFIRALTAVCMNQKTLFSNEELEEQKRFTEFKINQTSKNKIGEFNVVDGDYNLHSFIDNGLTDEDKEFLKDKDIIDAGAYIGDSTLPLSKITKANVYGFEPFTESYNKLKQNIELNNIKNIVPVNASLSDVNGEISLYLSGDNHQGITNDSTLSQYDKELVVQSRTIDSYVEENNLNVGFIKVDVEGAEQDLLKGAINTIRTQKPILFLSIYHKPDDFFTIKPWIESLDLGYEFKINKEQPWTFIADTILECRPKINHIKRQ